MKIRLGLAAWLLVTSPAAAQQSAEAVIARAVRAQGGLDTLSALRAGRTKVTGRLQTQPAVSFSQVTSYQLPDQLRQDDEVSLNGAVVRVTVVLDRDKGWASRQEVVSPLTPALLRELREAANLLRVSRLVGLLDRATYQLMLDGEAVVAGRRAQQVTVRRTGFRDIRLCFASDSGLLVQTARRTLDAETGREVTEERLLSDHRKTQGVLVPRKVAVLRDGQPFMEAEVVDVVYVDRLDPALFSKP